MGAELGGQAEVDFRAGVRRPMRYWLTRFVLLRGLGLMHVVAFGVAVHQAGPLIGSRGLLPAADFLTRMRDDTPFWSWPTLFYWNASDAMLGGLSWLGLCLALLVLLGAENALLLAALWAIYMSFCHVGQVFWGYGCAGDPMGLALLSGDPFDGEPPRYIRAELYRYRFTRLGDATDAYWRRQRVDSYLAPLSLDDPALMRFVRARGWAGATPARK